MELLSTFLLVLIVVLVFLLIGERRQAQQAKQQAEHDLNFIQKAARTGSWEWDFQSNTTCFSPTGLDILGLDSDCPVISNRKLISYIYHADRRNYINNIETSINNKIPFTGEFRCDLQKPFKRWFKSQGQVITDTNALPVKMIGMHHDITKELIQRNMQKAMEAILSNIVEHEELGVILTKICSVTQAIEPSIHCVIFHAENGDNKFKLYHSPSLPQSLKHILNSITAVDPQSELFQTLKNKEPTSIKVLNDLNSWQSANQVHNTLNLDAYYGQSLSDNQNVDQGALCLYLQDREIPEDIVYQILETVSRVASVALEGQLQTDNKQKIQHQLYHSQKMESLGHLTGGIAHDFNNILGSIVGYNNLARKISIRQNDHKLNQFLNEVSTAAERARDLISQMMIFSRSEPSKNIMVQVQPVIKEVLQLVRSMIPSSISITHQFESNLEKIKINPIALHQVILNLLVNAKDAISTQVGEISVRVYRTTQTSAKCISCHESFGGTYICIEVIDSGTGIPTELMERIFEPFFTTKDIGRGSGMGLSVVHGITHEMDAHICATSDPNRGTSIRIYFPPMTDDNNNEKDKQLLKTETTPPVGNGEHIMVVDDDIPLGLLYEEILVAYGYNVGCFDNSQLALEEFFNHPDKYSLILSDQTMPFMTGDEMAKQILSKRKNMPIIICTGFSEILNEDDVDKIGIRAILKKPVDMYKLLDLVEETIKENN